MAAVEIAEPLCSAISDRALNKTCQSVLCGKSQCIVTRPINVETFQNAAAALFYKDEGEALVVPLKRMLVGKFSCVPKLATLHDFFKKINLTGAYDIKWFDYKHIFIKLSNDLDYQRMWAKRDWYFDGTWSLSYMFWLCVLFWRNVPLPWVFVCMEQVFLL